MHHDGLMHCFCIIRVIVILLLPFSFLSLFPFFLPINYCIAQFRTREGFSFNFTQSNSSTASAQLSQPDTLSSVNVPMIIDQFGCTRSLNASKLSLGHLNKREKQAHPGINFVLGMRDREIKEYGMETLINISLLLYLKRCMHMMKQIAWKKGIELLFNKNEIVTLRDTEVVYGSRGVLSSTLLDDAASSLFVSTIICHYTRSFPTCSLTSISDPFVSSFAKGR